MKKRLEDEIKFKELLKDPIRLFGWIFPYFLVMILLLGIFYVNHLSALSFNEQPYGVPDTTNIKKDIQIKGNVVIISDKGDRLSTNYLNFNDAEKKVYTYAPVTIENKKMKIKGTGLTLYIKTGELNLSSLVKAKIN